MKNRTLFALALMMGLLLLPLGCGGNDPTDMDKLPDMDEPLVLQPTELCSENPNTAIVTFEDANLEARVRSALSVSPQRDLTCGLVSGLAELVAQRAGITSLVGIQNLTSLTGLFLLENPISDISALSGLTSLTSLDLNNTSISDISALSGLTSLTGLAFHNTSISDISVLSGLTSLTGLFLWDNSITDINALSGLTSLTILYLRGNSITDISALSGLTSLRFIDLDNNSISDIQPLLDNTGLGVGVTVRLSGTSVSCTDVAALEAKGVTVVSDCP